MEQDMNMPNIGANGNFDMNVGGQIHMGGGFRIGGQEGGERFNVMDRMENLREPAAKHGGNSFVDSVHSARNSSQKLDLIQAFVQGMIAGGGHKPHHGHHPHHAGHKHHANGADHGTRPADANPVTKPDAKDRGQADKAGKDDVSLPAVANELQNLAQAFDSSKLPESTQRKMLDGIADLLGKLQETAEKGGDVRKAAIMGLADLAKKLDSSRGSDAAKGAVMDQMSDSIMKIATGNLEDPSAAGDEQVGEEEGADETTGTSKTDDTSETDETSEADEECECDDTATSSASDENDGVWSHSVKDGKAEINLGDRYKISCEEGSQQWIVTDNETGKQTKISGDPHVDKDNDGKNDFDFKKNMSFVLEDGTKITVNTVPYGDSGQTLSSKLTITKGDKAMVVEGLAGDADGKDNLRVTQSDDGRAMDRTTPDGFRIFQDTANGWVTKDGKMVDQAVINKAEGAGAA
jgi:Domain of Unknown Function (DUF1521)